MEEDPRNWQKRSRQNYKFPLETRETEAVEELGRGINVFPCVCQSRRQCVLMQEDQEWEDMVDGQELLISEL